MKAVIDIVGEILLPHLGSMQATHVAVSIYLALIKEGHIPRPEPLEDESEDFE